ncbi:hypothetical protein ACIGCK_08400 [Microbacterium sp. NPDC078428]|uniref:hypothetical protein n=1 Tax=Microbacterium sp. NPDC078428 TaxID=3364190 RepID=UPI0037C8510A
MADTTGQYFSRFDRALRVDAGEPEGGRLSAKVAIGIANLDGSDPRTVQAEFQLMGPGDVARLASAAILRRFPAPGAGDAEKEKLAHVEFAERDLPWRYTPNRPSGEQLDPWLALVVGVRGADGISTRPDGSVRLSTAVQNAHALGDSWQWAHVHKVGTFERSRLLSPVALTADTSYIAVVVPAFAPDGERAWSGAAPLTLPCYDRWEFRTGLLGDFPDLARQLRKADLADLALRGGRPFGRADLEYRPRTGAPAVTLSAAGALRVPADPPPDPADAPPPPEIAADVAALQTEILSPDGRRVITAPDYPGAFRPLDAPPPAAGTWPAQLTEDPRLRGAAGLGAWTAIAWQDRIADAAAVRLGDTTSAAERIRALALGVAATRSLWHRRIPGDSEQALLVLAPVLGRLPADGVGSTTVLRAIRARHSSDSPGRPSSPQLAPALFSSAARRALRPGTARSSLAASGQSGVATLVAVAAGCPDATDRGDVLEKQHPDPQFDPLRSAVEAIRSATDDPSFAESIVDRLFVDREVEPHAVAAVLLAMQPGPDGRIDHEALGRLLESRDFPPLPEPDGAWEETLDEFAPECAPVDVGRLGGLVVGAINPMVPEPPAAIRVFATLPGVRSMRPLEVEPELDIPLWSFLSTSSPDWMLPGVGDLAKHEVIAVETNPLFVEALLVGANKQTTEELRWRNVPMRPRSSPLRRFWQRTDRALAGKPDAVHDIRPIRLWPDASALGDPALTPDARSSEAVVVFNSPLFTRYPTTVVYLYDARPAAGAPPDWDDPPGQDATLAEPRRVDFTFTGTIGPHVTFFGFPRTITQLAHHWVVLEEPPAGYRFTQATAPLDQVPETQNHGGQFAHRRFALPVRVLMGPLV